MYPVRAAIYVSSYSCMCVLASFRRMRIQCASHIYRAPPPSVPTSSYVYAYIIHVYVSIYVGENLAFSRERKELPEYKTYIYTGENLAFSRERKEMRDNFDQDAKAMKRQIEILQVSLYVGVTPQEAASNTLRGCC